MDQYLPPPDGAGAAAPDEPADYSAVFVDRRVIAFRAPALCALLTSVWQDNGSGMHARAIRFSTAQQMLHVEVEQAGRRLGRQVLSSELLPLIIAYCIGARIGLPANAEKSVLITTGGAVLDCVIGHGSLPPYRRTRAQAGRLMGEW
jgi:hypothetical protein